MRNGSTTTVIVGNSFLGSYTNATTGYSGNNFDGHFTNNSTANTLQYGDLQKQEIAVVDPKTKLGVSLSDIPDSFQLVSYLKDQNRDAFYASDAVKRGHIKEYSKQKYTAHKPFLVYVENLTNDLLGGTLEVGRSVEFTLDVTRMHLDIGILPKHLVYQVSTTTLDTEVGNIIKLINQNRVKDLQGQGYRYVAVGINSSQQIATTSRTGFAIIQLPQNPDYFNIKDNNLYRIELYLDRYYEANTGDNQWIELDNSKVKYGSFSTSYTFTDSVYTAGTVSSSTKPLNGTGSSKQVLSRFNQYQRGNQGLQNFVGPFADNPYIPVKDGVCYDVYTIKYWENRGPGLRPYESKNYKIMEIYIDTSDSTSNSDAFSDYMDAILADMS